MLETALPGAPANTLLSLLPRPEYRKLAAYLHAVTLPAKKTIYKRRATIDSVYFPTGCMISAMAVMADGASIEVATIGNEGMSGLTAMTGGLTSPYEVLVQVPGRALRLPIERFQEAIRDLGQFGRILGLYNTAFATQVSYSVACNGLHTIERRCCRWLLMCADRVGNDTIALTHEFLGVMLGVRRSSVSEVLKLLQERGLLRTRRGQVEIVDRKAVEKTSCECYGAVKSEFERLFGTERSS